MREAEEKGERKRGEGREKARKRVRESEEKGERKRGKVYEKAGRRERESKDKGEGKQGEGRENARKMERGKNRYYRNGYDIKQDIVYLTIYEK